MHSDVTCFFWIINFFITEFWLTPRWGEFFELFYFIEIFISYWNIVDLQCYVSFRCAAKWFSYTYTCIYSFSNSFPIEVITEYWVEFPVIYSRTLLVIYFIYSGEGDGTPLQYSCLENPMDGGGWKAAVHGVAEGWTRLSNWTEMGRNLKKNRYMYMYNWITLLYTWNLHNIVNQLWFNSR